MTLHHALAVDHVDVTTGPPRSLAQRKLVGCALLATLRLEDACAERQAAHATAPQLLDGHGVIQTSSNAHLAVCAKKAVFDDANRRAAVFDVHRNGPSALQRRAERVDVDLTQRVIGFVRLAATGRWLRNAFESDNGRIHCTKQCMYMLHVHIHVGQHAYTRPPLLNLISLNLTWGTTWGAGRSTGATT